MQLVEYYKFHVEVPRLFAHFVGPKVLRYHQKKRNIYYQKICTRLQDETSSHKSNSDIKQSSINKELEDVFLDNMYRGLKMDIGDDRLESQSIRQLRDKLSELLRVDHPQLSTLRVEYPKRTAATNRNRVDDLMAKLNIRIGGQPKINQEDQTLKMKQENLAGGFRKAPLQAILTHSTEIKPTKLKPRPTINIAFAKSFDSRVLEGSSSPQLQHKKSPKQKKSAKNKQSSVSKDKQHMRKSSERVKHTEPTQGIKKPMLCHALKKHLKDLPEKRRQMSNPYDMIAAMDLHQNMQPRSSHQGKPHKKLGTSPEASQSRKIEINSILRSRKSSDSVRILFDSNLGAYYPNSIRGSVKDPSFLRFNKTFRQNEEPSKGTWKKEIFIKSKKPTKSKTKSSHNLLAASASNLELSTKTKQRSNLQVKLDILDNKLAGKIQECFHARRDTLPVDLIMREGRNPMFSPGRQSSASKRLNDFSKKPTDQMARQPVISTRHKLSERGLGGFVKLTKSQHLKTHHARLGSQVAGPLDCYPELPRDGITVKFSPKFSSRISKY